MITAKAITPVTRFKPGEFRQAMHAEALTVAAEMGNDFNKTTRTWKHKVDFETVVKTPPGEVSAAVSTKDEIYGYVDKGTKPHRIRPKKGGFLAFQGKYKSKTTPHVINSHQGGASGQFVYTRKAVKHPGTDAREFSRDIQAKWQPKLADRMQKVINRTARITSR